MAEIDNQEEYYGLNNEEELAKIKKQEQEELKERLKNNIKDLKEKLKSLKSNFEYLSSPEYLIDNLTNSSYGKQEEREYLINEKLNEIKEQITKAKEDYIEVIEDANKLNFTNHDKKQQLLEIKTMIDDEIKEILDSMVKSGVILERDKVKTLKELQTYITDDSKTLDEQENMRKDIDKQIDNILYIKNFGEFKSYSLNKEDSKLFIETNNVMTSILDKIKEGKIDLEESDGGFSDEELNKYLTVFDEMLEKTKNDDYEPPENKSREDKIKEIKESFLEFFSVNFSIKNRINGQSKIPKETLEEMIFPKGESENNDKFKDSIEDIKKTYSEYNAFQEIQLGIKKKISDFPIVGKTILGNNFFDFFTEEKDGRMYIKEDIPKFLKENFPLLNDFFTVRVGRNYESVRKDFLNQTQFNSDLEAIGIISSLIKEDYEVIKDEYGNIIKDEYGNNLLKSNKENIEKLKKFAEEYISAKTRESKFEIVKNNGIFNENTSELVLLRIANIIKNGSEIDQLSTFFHDKEEMLNDFDEITGQVDNLSDFDKSIVSVIKTQPELMSDFMKLLNSEEETFFKHFYFSKTGLSIDIHTGEIHGEYSKVGEGEIDNPILNIEEAVKKGIVSSHSSQELLCHIFSINQQKEMLSSIDAISSAILTNLSKETEDFTKNKDHSFNSLIKAINLTSVIENETIKDFAKSDDSGITTLSLLDLMKMEFDSKGKLTTKLDKELDNLRIQDNKQISILNEENGTEIPFINKEELIHYKKTLMISNPINSTSLITRRISDLIKENEDKISEIESSKSLKSTDNLNLSYLRIANSSLNKMKSEMVEMEKSLLSVDKISKTLKLLKDLNSSNLSDERKSKKKQTHIEEIKKIFKENFKEKIGDKELEELEKYLKDDDIESAISLISKNYETFENIQIQNEENSLIPMVQIDDITKPFFQEYEKEDEYGNHSIQRSLNETFPIEIMEGLFSGIEIETEDISLNRQKAIQEHLVYSLTLNSLTDETTKSFIESLKQETIIEVIKENIPEIRETFEKENDRETRIKKAQEILSEIDTKVISSMLSEKLSSKYGYEISFESIFLSNPNIKKVLTTFTPDDIIKTLDDITKPEENTLNTVMSDPHLYSKISSTDSEAKTILLNYIKNNKRLDVMKLSDKKTIESAVNKIINDVKTKDGGTLTNQGIIKAIEKSNEVLNNISQYERISSPTPPPNDIFENNQLSYTDKLFYELNLSRYGGNTSTEIFQMEDPNNTRKHIFSAIESAVKPFRYSKEVFTREELDTTYDKNILKLTKEKTMTYIEQQYKHSKPSNLTTSNLQLLGLNGYLSSEFHNAFKDAHKNSDIEPIESKKLQDISDKMTIAIIKNANRKSPEDPETFSKLIEWDTGSEELDNELSRILITTMRDKDKGENGFDIDKMVPPELSRMSHSDILKTNFGERIKENIFGNMQLLSNIDNDNELTNNQKSEMRNSITPYKKNEKGEIIKYIETDLSVWYEATEQLSSFSSTKEGRELSNLRKRYTESVILNPTSIEDLYSIKVSMPDFTDYYQDGNSKSGKFEVKINNMVSFEDFIKEYEKKYPGLNLRQKIENKFNNMEELNIKEIMDFSYSEIEKQLSLNFKKKIAENMKESYKLRAEEYQNKAKEAKKDFDKKALEAILNPFNGVLNPFALLKLLLEWLQSMIAQVESHYNSYLAKSDIAFKREAMLAEKFLDGEIFSKTKLINTGIDVANGLIKQINGSIGKDLIPTLDSYKVDKFKDSIDESYRKIQTTDKDGNNLSYNTFRNEGKESVDNYINALLNDGPYVDENGKMQFKNLSIEERQRFQKMLKENPEIEESILSDDREYEIMRDNLKYYASDIQRRPDGFYIIANTGTISEGDFISDGGKLEFKIDDTDEEQRVKLNNFFNDLSKVENKKYSFDLALLLSTNPEGNTYTKLLNYLEVELERDQEGNILDNDRNNQLLEIKNKIENKDENLIEYMTFGTLFDKISTLFRDKSSVSDILTTMNEELVLNETKEKTAVRFLDIKENVEDIKNSLDNKYKTIKEGGKSKEEEYKIPITIFNEKGEEVENNLILTKVEKEKLLNLLNKNNTSLSVEEIETKINEVFGYDKNKPENEQPNISAIEKTKMFIQFLNSESLNPKREMLEEDILIAKKELASQHQLEDTRLRTNNSTFIIEDIQSIKQDDIETTILSKEKMYRPYKEIYEISVMEDLIIDFKNKKAFIIIDGNEILLSKDSFDKINEAVKNQDIPISNKINIAKLFNLITKEEYEKFIKEFKSIDLETEEGKYSEISIENIKSLEGSKKIQYEPFNELLRTENPENFKEGEKVIDEEGNVLTVKSISDTETKTVEVYEVTIIDIDNKERTLTFDVNPVLLGLLYKDDNGNLLLRDSSGSEVPVLNELETKYKEIKSTTMIIEDSKGNQKTIENNILNYTNKSLNIDVVIDKFEKEKDPKKKETMEIFLNNVMISFLKENTKNTENWEKNQSTEITEKIKTVQKLLEAMGGGMSVPEITKILTLLEKTTTDGLSTLKKVIEDKESLITEKKLEIEDLIEQRNSFGEKKGDAKISNERNKIDKQIEKLKKEIGVLNKEIAKLKEKEPKMENKKTDISNTTAADLNRVNGKGNPSHEELVDIVRDKISKDSTEVSQDGQEQDGQRQEGEWQEGPSR